MNEPVLERVGEASSLANCLWLLFFSLGSSFGFALGFCIQLFAFGLDALEEDGSGFVGGVLGDELASEGFGEDGLFKLIDLQIILFVVIFS